MPSFDFLRRRKASSSAGSAMPDSKAVLKALAAYIGAPSYEEKRAVMEREQQLLLHPSYAALAWLDAFINSAQQSQDPKRIAEVPSLQFHRAVLQRAMAVGIPAAWAEFAAFTAEFKAQNPALAAALSGASTDPGVHLSEEESERITITAALQVVTFADAPTDWARLQADLGNNYLRSTGDDRAKILAKATEAYEAALQVYTEESFPVEWATVVNNLGVVYGQRGSADDLEQAIKYLRNALHVRTRDSSPLDWAMTETNLGLAYKNRVQGDHADNIEQAIACFTAAIGVISRDASPDTWAAVQTNLGEAYRQRVVGDRAENLRQAIATYDAALEVWTAEASPARHRQTEIIRSEFEALLREVGAADS